MISVPRFLTRTATVTLGTLLLLSCAVAADYAGVKESVVRIAPQEARHLVTSGRALLVCAYSDDRCASRLLEGALLLSQFESQTASLSREQEIIFYCS
jgi:hypothetical protein